jgi:hypothetical protein
MRANNQVKSMTHSSSRGVLGTDVSVSGIGAVGDGVGDEEDEVPHGFEQGTFGVHLEG